MAQRRRKPVTIADESSQSSLRATLNWYFSKVYGRLEGPGTLPFYCDSRRVGVFAVEPGELAAGEPATLFKLFVCLAMYQARRDIVIMRQQAAMSRPAAKPLLSVPTLRSLVRKNRCMHLNSAASFDAGCSVYKRAGNVDCDCRPGVQCHVKDATVLLNRMGDMGKLPTSAWLHVWDSGGIATLLREIQLGERNPQRRAELLVNRFARIYRVGEKLATMFVSALSTPALAPGLTPWFPAVDGNELVIIDTNVARAVALLKGPTMTATYAQRVQWIRGQAHAIDLRDFDRRLPRFSPRVVQQALYAFCSKSNRLVQGTACPTNDDICAACVSELCPFAPASRQYPGQP